MVRGSSYYGEKVLRHTGVRAYIVVCVEHCVLALFQRFMTSPLHNASLQGIFSPVSYYYYLRCAASNSTGRVLRMCILKKSTGSFLYWLALC